MINSCNYDYKSANLISVEPNLGHRGQILRMLTKTAIFFVKSVILGQKWQFLVKMVDFCNFGVFFIFLLVP